MFVIGLSPAAEKSCARKISGVWLIAEPRSNCLPRGPCFACSDAVMPQCAGIVAPPIEDQMKKLKAGEARKARRQ
jgi:hypothetical protein